MTVPEAVALDIPAEEGSPVARVPRRIRRRLLQARESSADAPATAGEIEAKLRDAQLRRQQFHEKLSCKARHAVRSTSQPSQEEDPKQRLEAKLVAAKQKRLSLLEKEQNRLAKLDELRQAGKKDAEMRFNREREELGMRVEHRVQQAEENRIQLLHARLQRRAALEERTKKFFGQRVTSENKYRETTVVLAAAFDVLGINQESANSLPFEKLALCIESTKVLQTARALLDCLESCFILSETSSSCTPENIDHLLKHLGSPNTRILPSSAARARVTPKRTTKNSDAGKLPRYSPRVVLCAYMILGHPGAVFNVQGERDRKASCRERVS